MNALTTDLSSWTAVGEAQLPDAINLRRAIHAEPELGLDLPKTTAKVKAALAAFSPRYLEPLAGFARS